VSKKFVALALAALLINLFCVAPVAAAKREKEARFARQVRDEIARLGTGPQALVEVSLRDSTKLKGYVREADETRFVVVDAKAGAATAVPYPQVRKVTGNNLSTGAKITIGVGIGFGIMLLIVGVCALVDECAGA
jgi:hypothetical protein